MKLPSELLRQLYDTPIFRGTRTTRGRGPWWTGNPEDASNWAGIANPHTGRYIEGANVIPGQANTRDFVDLDLGGTQWDHIDDSHLQNYPDMLAVLNEVVGGTRQYFRPYNADEIGEVAGKLGYPGVTFRNILDSGHTAPQTHYYFADLGRRRSRFARFEDPNSDDMMASLVLALLGGGAGAGYLAQQDREQT